MAMEMRNRLQNNLKVTVPVADLLQGPSVRQLASTVLEIMQLPGSATVDGNGGESVGPHRWLSLRPAGPAMPRGRRVPCDAREPPFAFPRAPFRSEMSSPATSFAPDERSPVAASRTRAAVALLVFVALWAALEAVGSLVFHSIAVWQVVFVRYAIHVAIVLALWGRKSPWRTRRLRYQLRAIGADDRHARGVRVGSPARGVTGLDRDDFLERPVARSHVRGAHRS